MTGTTLIIIQCECGREHAINPAAILGSKGGSSTSEAKKAAAKANGSAPCAPGKKRGRPGKIKAE